MGWKTFKDHFGLTKHTVCVDKGGDILVGSGYVSDLLRIHADGHIVENKTFSGFLSRYYPDLKAASSEEIVSLIQAVDVFQETVPVFTFEGAEIVEKRCEALGWPNVTTEGDLMYENTYFRTRELAAAKAKASASSGLQFFKRRVADLSLQLEAAQADLAQCASNLAKLESDFPSVLTCAPPQNVF